MRPSVRRVAFGINTQPQVWSLEFRPRPNCRPRLAC